MTLSRDKSMLAIYKQNDYNIMIYSVDNEKKSTTKRLTLKQSVRASSIRFAFLNITTGREFIDQINITYNRKKSICSPTGSGQRVLVQDLDYNGDKRFYIASSWESKFQEKKNEDSN
jgi:hypothetical protein